MARRGRWSFLGLISVVCACGGSRAPAQPVPGVTDAGLPRAQAQGALDAGAATPTAPRPFDAGTTTTLQSSRDAGRSRFSHCDAGAIDDADAGESPYADTCLIDEQVGVFVDGTAGDDAADGTRDRPLKSLAAAIRLAVNQHKHVYACAGTYEEPMRIGTDLSVGLELYGSLSCATFLPAGPPAAARSIVRNKGKGSALTISDTQTVIVVGFDFENVSSDGAAGTSYVGALVSNAKKITLRDVRLHAASGEAGADGAPPKAQGMAASVGLAGGDACAASASPGGVGGSTPGCKDTAMVSPGGSGGLGGTGSGDGGGGTWLQFGAGGAGETNGAAWSCAAGSGGAPNVPAPQSGGPGAGASGFGALLSGGFVGFSGQPGYPGIAGYGGGGGGGARAPSSCPGLSTPSGASGGGGGGGGCGGEGGKGGAPGGSSFGLIAIDSDVRFDDGRIEIGDGGHGGRGALGQLGSKGAAGGPGGKGAMGSKAGCSGGAGGDGGRGGPGGGGNGGHAIAVLYLGRAPRLNGVSGEAEASANHAGAAGLPPIDSDASFTMQLTGSAGVAAFTYGL